MINDLKSTTMATKQINQPSKLVQAKAIKRKRVSNPKAIVQSKLPMYEPPLLKVSLQAKKFPLYDVAFKRRYLVEDRVKEGKYQIGELVWAKLKGWPWWPAMVSVHPQRDVYFRYHSDGNLVSFHVQYFGRKPYHGWASEYMIQPFEGFDNFHRKMSAHIDATLPEKLNHVIQNYSVHPEQVGQLNYAIAEAEEAVKMDRMKRLHDLTYRFYSLKYRRYC